MNQNGRIPICGQISQYNEKTTEMPADLAQLIKDKNVHREWFLVMKFQNQFDEAWEKLFKWVQEGKIKNKETLYHGIENVPKAFIGLFEGDNIGKAIIKIN